MIGYAARPRGLRLPSLRAAVWAATLACTAAVAQSAAAVAAIAATSTPITNSSLDAPLFYQVLIGELELKSGRPGNAFEVLLDAARRQGDEPLFQRAVEIALQARAGDQALAASQAWRSAKPQSVAALRYQVQILLALN